MSLPRLFNGLHLFSSALLLELLLTQHGANGAAAVAVLLVAFGFMALCAQFLSVIALDIPSGRTVGLLGLTLVQFWSSAGLLGGALWHAHRDLSISDSVIQEAGLYFTVNLACSVALFLALKIRPNKQPPFTGA